MCRFIGSSILRLNIELTILDLSCEYFPPCAKFLICTFAPPMIITSLLIASFVFSQLYLVMIVYFLFGWLKLKRPSAINQGTKLPFVSVIIPVRNEATHIGECLESIFKQSYPNHLFEVIVIDDFSTDSTLQTAREQSRKNLLVLDLQQYLGRAGEYSPNKKKAIALGIKNAQGELVITTDGDCIAGENWLQSMVEYYTSNSYKLITGPVMMKPAVFPIEIFQQLDVINLSAITGATISNGTPVMCNGANLMYSKEVFAAVGGFKGNHEVPSGDDIFLMQKINAAYENSVGYVKNFEACVFTKPERSFSSFLSQRVRWVSKSSRFSHWGVSSVLVFAYFFNLFVIVAALSAFHPTEHAWLPVAVAGGTKLFADFVFAIPATIFFRKWILLLLLPVIEVFHILYVIVIGVLSLTGKYRWKDRTVQ